MMQSSLAESLFSGDPFFEPSRILWPLRRSPLGEMREDFIQRRSALADGFLKELGDAFPYDFLKGGALHSSSLLAGGATRRPSSEGNLELSLDVREFSPEDITVKLAGRQLAVVAARQSEEGASKRRGFVQKISLPDHVDPSAITCSLSADGLLKIEAPAAQRGPSEERTVPIRFRTSLNVPITNVKKGDSKEGPEKKA
ncbi:hypothetical protein AAFF_G00341670 [Aldrovandia affinis]|uniref:SHSP domain-containing protein n=1 Tax=Aldrovandia affinis TaxID=143900 RepID=A0AAD7SKR8_9TELE|nr:hypothetical protein AAFF_G00341670 [Aldrovandia affinis]